MKRIGLVLVAAFCWMVIPGCGLNFTSDNSRVKKPAPQNPNNPDQPYIPVVGTNDDTANAYKVQDTACQFSGAGLNDLSQLKPLQIINGILQKSTTTWDRGNSVVSLSAAGVSETRIGFHRKLECTYENDDVKCGSTSGVVDTGKLLKVCDASEDFERKSLESISVTSMAALDQSNQFFNLIRGTENALPAVRLYVMPTLEKNVKVRQANGTVAYKSLYETDNLAYASKFDGGPTFIVYQRGKKSVELGLWKNFNLWESSWVLAHEFGHHVFRNIAAAISTADANAMFQEFLPIINWQRQSRPMQSFSLATDRTKLVEVFNSVNEAFADLFGYFSNNMTLPGMYELDCFKQNRDMNSGTFMNGTAKVMTKENLDIFFARVANPNNESVQCDVPDFADSHAIGAIVARGVIDLMKSSGRYSTSNAAQNGQLLIRWAEQMIADMAINSSATEEEFFAHLIASLIKSLNVTGRDAEMCATLSADFPGLKAEIAQSINLRCS